VAHTDAHTLVENRSARRLMKQNHFLAVAQKALGPAVRQGTQGRAPDRPSLGKPLRRAGARRLFCTLAGVALCLWTGLAAVQHPAECEPAGAVATDRTAVK